MAINQQEFERLRDYIKKNCALEVKEDKTYLIESRLSQLVIESGAKSFHDFYLLAQQPQNHSLRDKIIDAITTHETFWFRDDKPWVFFREKLIPDFVSEIRSGKKSKIRIWSAACSTGQEPYSLAMLIDEIAGPQIAARNFEIVGTDVSPNTIFNATVGRYNQIEMSRGLTPASSYVKKYFTSSGSVSVINEDIRKRVHFKRYNLQDSFASLGKFDLILCRNVIIYFSDTFKKELMERFRHALVPGGFFMLGASESMLGYSEAFHVKEHKGAIYYQVK